MVMAIAFSFGLQWYALKYLPPVDCLPFKKGNNIPEKMKMPADAVPDIFETRLIYKNTVSKEVKNMSQDEFNNSKIWEDSTWKWDTTMTKLVKKGKNNEPPIKGFSLSGATTVDTLSGTETKAEMTETVLTQPATLLLFSNKFPDNSPGWKNDLLSIYSEAKKKAIPFYFITSNRALWLPFFAKMGFENAEVLSCDFTVIRTAARVDPTLYLIKKGTVDGKWGYANFNDAKKAIEK